MLFTILLLTRRRKLRPLATIVSVSLGHVRDDWIRVLRGICRHWSVIVLALFCVVSFLPLAGLAVALEAVGAVAEVAQLWPLEAYSYSLLAAHYAARRWISSAVVMTLVILSFPAGLILLELIKTVIEVPFQFFYTINPRYYRVNQAYSAFEQNKIGRTLGVFKILYLALFAIIVIRRLSDHIDAKTAAKTAIDLVGWAFIGAVALVWTLIWLARFRILHRHHLDGSLRFYRQYLFSTDGVVRGFKGMFDLLVFLAVLGWVLLPAVLGGIVNLPSRMAARFESDWHYSQRRQIVVNNDEFTQFLKASKMWVPPPTDRLVSELNVIPELYDPEQVRLIVIQQLMSYCLIAVTFSGLLYVGIPTVYLFYKDGGAWRLIQRTLVTTVKTVIVSLVVQVMLAKAYMVDVSEVTGFTTVFVFLMTFFLTLETVARSGPSESAT